MVDEGALEVKGLKWTQVQTAGLGCLAGLEGVSASPWQNMIFKPWPLNGPRKLSETDFEQFAGLAAKWPQEAPRKLILSIVGAWPQNGPRKPPEG